MRFLKTIVVLVVLTGALASRAQEPDASMAPLEHGPLLIWIVRPGTTAEKLRIKAQKIQAQVQATQVLPTTVQEQTAGTFGQPSSNVGQTAGSYGQTSSSSGRNASDTGQTAGSYGTPAGGFGGAASHHGQTAGSVGQTAGSFGQTSSTYGHTLGGASLAPSGAAPVSMPPDSATLSVLTNRLKTLFPELEPRFADVIAEELEDKLAAVEGSADYPDVLIATGMPEGWDESGLGVTRLGLPTFLDMPDPRLQTFLMKHEIYILRHAPNSQRARAFLVWLYDPDPIVASRKEPLDKIAEAAARVAAGALGRVLGGDGLGDDADIEAAEFKGNLARTFALGPVPAETLSGLGFKVDVTNAVANDRLAVVTLRTIASSPLAFGVMRAHVVLRKDDAGRWRVLQISPNVHQGVPGSSWSSMYSYARVASPAKVVGVSQAAPLDGDNRPPQPDLWWDNNGGSGMLAVEWQIHLGDWTDSHMFLVPDHDPRVKTRVKAEFARMSGKYRWRVWALGAGGVVKLSPWRELNILQ